MQDGGSAWNQSVTAERDFLQSDREKRFGKKYAALYSGRAAGTGWRKGDSESEKPV